MKRRPGNPKWMSYKDTPIQKPFPKEPLPPVGLEQGEVPLLEGTIEEDDYYIPESIRHLWKEDAPPWELMTKETGEREPLHWYARFEKFRLKGPLRKVLHVYREELVESGRYTPEAAARKYTSPDWIEASRTWDWKGRAALWDDHVRQQERYVWDQRRKELREREWAMGTELDERALMMMKFPLEKRTIEKDGQIINVYPADWKASDVARYMETSSKLKRLAADMNTDQIGINLEALMAALPIDLREEVKAALADELLGNDELST